MTITRRDCEVLRRYREAGLGAWTNMPEQDRDVYRKIHNELAEIALDAAGKNFQIAQTSGFSPRSGVRGNRPKDLWCALSAPGSDVILSMPQIYLIISDRGAELGFAAAIHPSDFSNQEVKERLRKIVPSLFAALPDDQSNVARSLSDRLPRGGNWRFRKKNRLAPHEADEFEDLSSFLRFLKSPQGVTQGAGVIVRYILPNELENADLKTEFRTCVELFGPLVMETYRSATRNDPRAPAGSEPTFTNAASYWVEKTLVAERPDRKSGPHALGNALWSPQRSKRGSDIYRNVRSVRPGDIILHLIDNKRIAGISICASQVDDTFLGVEGTTWADRPAYRVQLKDYVPLEPAILRDEFFSLPHPGSQLKEISERHEVFYTTDLKLRQGAYLTAAPEELVAIFDSIYRQKTGRGLPHVKLQETEPEPEVQEVERLSIEWLAERTLWPKDRLAVVVDALNNHPRQIILAGPPGTGKTWLAKHIAQFVTNDNREHVRTVQFHPSYGYEEFIEGIFPSAKDGHISFQPKNGVLLDLVDEMAGSDAPHVLVVDEMNRANLPRVFGELMYLLEYRDEEISLQHRKTFSLPKNLLLIGTMNTADRSIRSIDIALRRRFDVFECWPSREILEAYYGTNANEMLDLFDGFERLNEKLTEYLDRHHTIGHTFFMVETMDAPKLRRIWDQKIGPLIEEYFFDQPGALTEFTPDHFWAQIE